MKLNVTKTPNKSHSYGNGHEAIMFTKYPYANMLLTLLHIHCIFTVSLLTWA